MTIHDFFEHPSETAAVNSIDSCRRCFEPYGDDVAYCTRCGAVSTVFRDVTVSGRCAYHPTEGVLRSCSYCRRGCCESCYNEFTEGKTSRSYHCQQCEDKRANIELNFLSDVREKNICPRHRTDRGEFKCVNCNLPACSSCAYVAIKGWVFKRLVKGPVCHYCRWSVLGHHGNYKVFSIKQCREKAINITK